MVKSFFQKLDCPEQGTLSLKMGRLSCLVPRPRFYRLAGCGFGTVENSAVEGEEAATSTDCSWRMWEDCIDEKAWS